MKMFVAPRLAKIHSTVSPRKSTICLCTCHNWNTQLPEGVSLSLPASSPLLSTMVDSILNVDSAAALYFGYSPAARLARFGSWNMKVPQDSITGLLQHHFPVAQRFSELQTDLLMVAPSKSLSPWQHQGQSLQPENWAQRKQKQWLWFQWISASPYIQRIYASPTPSILTFDQKCFYRPWQIK